MIDSDPKVPLLISTGVNGNAVQKSEIAQGRVFGETFRHLSTESLSFCGKDIHLPEIDLAMKADNWESTKMLQHVCHSDLDVDNLLDFEDFRESCIRNTQAEYDAEKLCTYLEARVASGSLELSSEFMAFEKAWRRDELNHAIGFSMIEALLCNNSSIIETDYIQRRFDNLRQTEGSFYSLEEQGFLADEFTVAVAIAYDEIRTAMQYGVNAKREFPVLDRTIDKVLVRWITSVARDEAHHWSNICQVIRRKHAHRLQDLPGLVERMVRYETSSEYRYDGTFIFDHPSGTAQIESSVQAARKVIHTLCHRP